MDFKSLFRNTSYSAQAREVIRHFILSGAYAPGERLREVEISQSLGISRSPVREAIQSLANEGLVKLVPQKGAFVASFDVREVRELYEVREALEVTAVQLATERAEERQINELEKLLEATQSALRSSESSSYPRDLDFHKHIADLAQNFKLAQKIGEINSQLELVRLRSASRPGRAKQAYEEHVAVFDALRRRDAEAAAQAMRRHIHNGKASMLTVLADGDSGAA